MILVEVFYAVTVTSKSEIYVFEKNSSLFKFLLLQKS